MKLLRKVGATSEIWQIFIADSSSTTGAGLTGLTNASGSLTAYYHRDTDTTATVISLVTMTVGTFTSSGFKEIDSSNMPGWYQFCPPNAALASGAKSCSFHLKGAANMAPLPIEVDLDGQADVTHWNGTAVTPPNTAGTPVVDVGRVNNVSTSSVTTINANVGQTQPVNFTGTGASALVKGDAVDIAGVAVSTSTAQIGVNVVNFGGSAGTFSSGRPEVNAVQFAGQTITCSGGVTIPAATLASTTNITAGTITTTTNVTTLNGIAANVITAAAIADGAIDRATLAADTGLQSARSNTAAAGAAGTITLDASASATDDFYKGMVVYLTGGTGVGQARLITGYTGSTQVATVTPNWTTNPGATSTFAILPWGYVLGLSGITFPTNFSAFSIDASGRTDLGKWIGVAPLALSSQQVQAIVPDAQKVDLNTIKTQTVTCSGGVTVPAATLASTTNITSATGIDVTKVAGTTVASASAGYFPADVRQFGGSAGTFSGGRPEVNTTHIAGVVWASTTLFTLASHDPGATIGTSTLTQTQVTGGAYSVQSASCVLGDARIANLDAAVSTRGTSTLTQTQVTGGAYSVQSSSCVLGDARIANLDVAVSNVVQNIYSGTATGGDSTTAVLGAGASSRSSDYVGAILVGLNQPRLITDYNGGTRTATFTPAVSGAGYGPGGGFKIVPLSYVAGVNALGTQAKADVNAEVDTALADIKLDKLLAAGADFGLDVANDSVVATIISKTAVGSSFNCATDSLEALRDRGDAAWTTATSVTVSDKTGFSLSSAGNNAVADALLDRTDGVETGVTPRQAMRGCFAMLGGLVSGAGTGTEVFKAGGGGATTRLTWTVDSSGNRTAVIANL